VSAANGFYSMIPAGLANTGPLDRDGRQSQESSGFSRNLCQESARVTGFFSMKLAPAANESEISTLSKSEMVCGSLGNTMESQRV